MSVSPTSSRAGWHLTPTAGPGRPSGSSRRPGGGSPTLTVTLSIPLAGGEEALTAPARRLLEAARELVERGEATVSGVPLPAERRTESSTPVPAPRPAEKRRRGLHILAASRSVLLEGEPLPLTRLEYDLLMHLVDNPRRVFTRMQLLAAVWGYEHAGLRTVDVHIRRLRGKVGTDVPLITTVYGVGYRLADDAVVTIDRDA
jgi:DNA-binding response OmpR family regulator